MKMQALKRARQIEDPQLMVASTDADHAFKHGAKADSDCQNCLTSPDLLYSCDVAHDVIMASLDTAYDVLGRSLRDMIAQNLDRACENALQEATDSAMSKLGGRHVCIQRGAGAPQQTGPRECADHPCTQFFPRDDPVSGLTSVC